MAAGVLRHNTASTPLDARRDQQLINFAHPIE